MSGFEAICLAAAGVLYAASFLGAVKRWQRWALICLVGGLVLHLASAAVRWGGAGHPPVFGTYEATLAASWILLCFVALSVASVHHQFRVLATGAVPIGLLLLAYGASLFDTQWVPLTISERSLWVELHALFAWLAFAPFTLACCLSGYYLWAGRRHRGGAPEPRDTNPSSDVIDELAFRYITVGFVCHSVMFALGSYYSSILFGTWWRWDPAFSLSLVAWFLVGIYTHMRLFFQWSGSRAARFYLFVYLLIAFSYWGLTYLPAGRTFHVFDLDLSAL